jgi:hypothetical protein
MSEHVSEQSARRPLLWTAALMIMGASVVVAPSADADTKDIQWAPPPEYSTTRQANPDRTIVTKKGAWVATFTDGARTVTMAGQKRTFVDPDPDSSKESIESTTWVRVLPNPFKKSNVDIAWLKAQLTNTTPDLLAQSTHYLAGSPTVLDQDDVLLSSDAHYGPIKDGKIQEGSDFNDYLGLDWDYAGTNDPNETNQLGSLDCSGFIRMLWGYRNGTPLSIAETPESNPAGALPRRAVHMDAFGPGVLISPNSGMQLKDLSKLSPGDLVFFDASSDDGAAIDHVGMFMGVDGNGDHRFISSRKTSDGPTMSDEGGTSTLNGNVGFYAKAYRSSRRL